MLMKHKVLMTLTALTGWMACCAAPPSAVDMARELKRAPAAEMPARAAELVTAAQPRHRKTAALQAINAALELNPASAPALVGALSKAVPDHAAAIAGAAARIQPKLAPQIARAAAAAVPHRVGEIVAEVCRVVPSFYRGIATAVAELAPEKAKEILEGVAAAIPSLGDAIRSAIGAGGGRLFPVALVLDSPTVTAAARPRGDNAGIGSVPRGPTLAPPYVPFSGSATGLEPADTGPVPRGGRNYAAP